MLGLIPIHDDNPTRNPAVVNWTLIAINVVVFFVSPISPLDVGGDANTPAGFCRQLAFFRDGHLTTLPSRSSCWRTTRWM